MSLGGLYETGDAWKYFEEMENCLDTIVNYVELDKAHEKVYSQENARTLIEICTYVEALLKEMVAYQGLDGVATVDQRRLGRARRNVKRGVAKIKDYREVLEPYYKLSRQPVAIGKKHKPYRKIRPFRNFGSKRSPDWWDAYNKVKHDRFANMKYAALKNVIESLAALFLLNVIHITGRLYAIGEGVIRHTVTGRVDLEFELDKAELWTFMKRFPDPRKMKPEGPISGTIWIRSRYFSFIYMG